MQDFKGLTVFEGDFVLAFFQPRKLSRNGVFSKVSMKAFLSFPAVSFRFFLVCVSLLACLRSFGLFLLGLFLLLFSWF